MIIGVGTESDPRTYKLYTRANNFIENERPPEKTIDRLQEGHRLATSGRNSVTLRSLTALYNCMGLVFATRRTWISCDEHTIERFREDDDLRELSGGLAAAWQGDIVVYYRDGCPMHIGVIARIKKNLLGSFDVLVLSKWGDAGEYLHNIDDVPDAYGRDKRILSDRKNV